MERTSWWCVTGSCTAVINLQKRGQGNLERWDPRMQTPRFTQAHWRKTSQWFAATRQHAVVVVTDREVNDAFERFCKPHMNQQTGLPITCSSNVRCRYLHL